MQKAVLFQGTIAQNLRWGNPDATEEQLWHAIEVAQAADVVKGKEGGLDYVIEQGGRNLSGGQKQRSSIARALMKNAPILILDDALSAVDTDTEEKILLNLRKNRAGKTTILIAHRISTVQGADKILVLDDGYAREIGTHEQLVARGGIYHDMVMQQQLEAKNGEVRA